MHQFKAVLATLLAFGTLPAALADDCNPLVNDGDRVGLICDRSNTDDAVIVLIAGLGGKGTWKNLRQYIMADGSLAEYDLLEYHTPKSKDIEEHFAYVASEINERWPDIRNLVIVGHSIGGIVVRTLALEDPDDRTFPVNPRFVVTYATPYEERQFHRSMLQRLASGFGFLIGAVKPLHRVAFNSERISEYTDVWREEVEEDEEAVARSYLAIYGRSDKTAPPDKELGKPFVVLIEGTHKNVVKPTRRNPCSYKVLKHLIETGEHGPPECLLP